MKTFIFILTVAVLASVQGNTTPGTTTRAPGFFSRLVGNAIRGGAGAANASLNIANDAMNYGTSLANRIGNGILGTKAQLFNLKMGVASDTLAFTTNATSAFAEIGKRLAESVPIPVVASMAGVGANFVDMGAKMVNTGGQMAFSAAQSVAQAKNNMASAGLGMGTELIKNMGGAGINMAQSGIGMGADMAIAVVDTAEGMIYRGTEMMEHGMALINNAAAQANTQLQQMGLQAQTNLNAGIASATGFGTTRAPTVAATGTATISGSGSVAASG